MLMEAHYVLCSDSSLISSLPRVPVLFPSGLFSVSCQFLKCIFCIWDKMLCLPFWVKLISFNMMTTSLIHSHGNKVISFFFMADWNSIVYTYHIFPIFFWTKNTWLRFLLRVCFADTFCHVLRSVYHQGWFYHQAITIYERKSLA